MHLSYSRPEFTFTLYWKFGFLRKNEPKKVTCGLKTSHFLIELGLPIFKIVCFLDSSIFLRFILSGKAALTMKMVRSKEKEKRPWILLGRGRSYIEHNVKIGNESFPAGISG